MPEHTPGYAATLVGQLARRPDALDAAEDDLAVLRGRIAIVTRFLHNPTIALDIRQGLARDLHLPTPEK
jgi:hypothetical protein